MWSKGFVEILRFLEFLLVFPSISLEKFINMITRQAFLANWDPAVQQGIFYIYIQYISYNSHELKTQDKVPMLLSDEESFMIYFFC